MPGKDLGVKHLCFKCGSKFYDLRKPVPVCPKCGADQRESPATRPAASERRSRAPAKPVAEPPAPLELDEEAEVDEEAEEAEEDDAQDGD